MLRRMNVSSLCTHWWQRSCTILGVWFFLERFSNTVIYVAHVQRHRLFQWEKAIYLEQERPDRPQVLLYVLIGVNALVATFIAFEWICQRCKEMKRLSSRDWSTERAEWDLHDPMFFWLCFMYWSGLGLDFAIFGVVQATSGARVVTYVVPLCRGAVFLFLAILIFKAGPEIVFTLMARRFEMDSTNTMRERDGAFLAELVDSLDVQVGQPWWVHLNEDEKDTQHPIDDHRHHWREGSVVMIQDDMFAVQLKDDRDRSVSAVSPATVSCNPRSPATSDLCDGCVESNLSLKPSTVMKRVASGITQIRQTIQMQGSQPSQQLDDLAAPQPTGSGRPGRSSCDSANSIGSPSGLAGTDNNNNNNNVIVRAVSTVRRTVGRAISTRSSTRTGSTIMSDRSSRSFGSSPSQMVQWLTTRITHRRTQQKHKWFPMANRNTPLEELLQTAQTNLRCIAWPDFTEELITSSKSSSRNSVNLFDLSRPLHHNEKIDYFMSHSWHDCAKKKFNALTSLAEAFKKGVKRYPTFWLDKVCIDQRDIASGLKVLPVYVMACSRILVICGPSYAYRLWCAWELCTLTSFVNPAEALERVELILLGDNVENGESDDDAIMKASEDLSLFDCSRATCYDPNEEYRLRQVIDAVGQERFNKKVRELTEELMRKGSRIRSSGHTRFATSRSFSMTPRRSTGMTRTPTALADVLCEVATVFSMKFTKSMDKNESGSGSHTLSRRLRRKFSPSVGEMPDCWSFGIGTQEFDVDDCQESVLDERVEGDVKIPPWSAARWAEQSSYEALQVACYPDTDEVWILDERTVMDVIIPPFSESVFASQTVLQV
jgi:hypothetical protein